VAILTGVGLGGGEIPSCRDFLIYIFEQEELSRALFSIIWNISDIPIIKNV
jgi:hypothetical protein